jgi:hypothetical protein
MKESLVIALFEYKVKSPLEGLKLVTADKGLLYWEATLANGTLMWVATIANSEWGRVDTPKFKFEP